MEIFRPAGTAETNKMGLSCRCSSLSSASAPLLLIPALPHFFPVLRLHTLGSPKENDTARETHGVEAAWAVTGFSWGSNAENDLKYVETMWGLLLSSVSSHQLL